MALFMSGTPCPYCGKPMVARDDLLGFTSVGYRPGSLLYGINDGVVHRKCLSKHPRRDEIVAAWNEAAEACLGPQYMLEVTRFGRVRFLSWCSRWRYRRRKRGNEAAQRLN
jgi:hypothetical protein